MWKKITGYGNGFGWTVELFQNFNVVFLILILSITLIKNENSCSRAMKLDNSRLFPCKWGVLTSVYMWSIRDKNLSLRWMSTMAHVRILPQSIMVEFVVTTEGRQCSKADRHTEEDLCSGIHPYLKKDMQTSLCLKIQRQTCVYAYDLQGRSLIRN